MKTLFSIIPSVRHPKDKIFLKREYNSIKGKKNGILIMLCGIVFLSLFSVMLGKAGLDYLNYKMNDPFIKWFNIPVSTYASQDDYADIKAFFEKSAQNNTYSISESTGSYRGLWRFYRQQSPGSIYAFVQSFSFWRDRELLNSILFEENNVIHAYSDLSNLNEDDLENGIIITQKLLEQIEASVADIQNTRILIKDGENLPLKVLAVVRSLPNKSQVFAENSLVFCLNKPGECEVSGSWYEKEGSLHVYLNTDEGNIDRVSQEIKDNILKNFGLQARSHSVETKNLGLFSHNILLKIELDEAIDKRLKIKIQDKLSLDMLYWNPAVEYTHALPTPHESRVYGLPDDGTVEAGGAIFDILSIKLDDLSEIPAFQEDLFDRFKIELDMNQVEAKKNFGVVSFLAIFLIVSLVFFAGIAILIYLYNLMKGHLQKIKMNIGTFLAFGMPRTFLYKGYMLIILRLMITATALSMLCLILVQLVLQLTTSPLNLPEFLLYSVALLNSWIWITVIVFFTISYLLFRRQLKTFLSHPPGDLIYGRK